MMYMCCKKGNSTIKYQRFLTFLQPRAEGSSVDTKSPQPA